MSCEIKQKHTARGVSRRDQIGDLRAGAHSTVERMGNANFTISPGLYTRYTVLNRPSTPFVLVLATCSFQNG